MIFSVLGWIGMILVLVAYILLSTNKIDNGMLYQVLNLLASVFMAIGLFPTKAWFSFALQVIWGFVAVLSMIKLLRTNKAK